ncbi:hypothetical protein FB451DRAFT_778998 [Mycena latifolia]|nr:hypothetical protein FB451DRAFT_778998 [Mycena latifolia]
MCAGSAMVLVGTGSGAAVERFLRTSSSTYRTFYPVVPQLASVLLSSRSVISPFSQSADPARYCIVAIVSCEGYNLSHRAVFVQLTTPLSLYRFARGPIAAHTFDFIRSGTSCDNGRLSSTGLPLTPRRVTLLCPGTSPINSHSLRYITSP